MRFLFVMPPIEYYSPVSGGAVATVTMHVARELEIRRHQVVVVAPEDLQPVYGAGTVEVVRIDSGGSLGRLWSHLEARARNWDHPGEGGFWRQVSAILKRVRPDVVVLANDLMGAERVRVALPDAKIVVWLHNECEVRGCRTHGLEAADVFLTCSDYIRGWFNKRHGHAGRSFTAHAGVCHETFYPSECHRNGPLRLLYVGRLDPNKGVDIAVRAVAGLESKGLQVSLSVVGSSWFYARRDAGAESFVNVLKRDMERAGVDWLGHVPRRWVPVVMREHDVALVLSRSNEPFGLVVLEAMASGLVVVASPHGGLSEACGGAGILADPGDEVGLQNELEALCKDRDKLLEWRRCSIQRATRARWGATAQVLLQAVANPVKGGVLV